MKLNVSAKELLLLTVDFVEDRIHKVMQQMYLIKINN